MPLCVCVCVCVCVCIGGFIYTQNVYAWVRTRTGVFSSSKVKLWPVYQKKRKGRGLSYIPLVVWNKWVSSSFRRRRRTRRQIGGKSIQGGETVCLTESRKEREKKFIKLLQLHMKHESQGLFLPREGSDLRKEWTIQANCLSVVRTYVQTSVCLS